MEPTNSKLADLLESDEKPIRSITYRAVDTNSNCQKSDFDRSYFW